MVSLADGFWLLCEVEGMGACGERKGQEGTVLLWGTGPLVTS